MNETKILLYNEHPNGKNLVVEIDKNNCWNVISHTNGNPYPMYRGTRVHIIMYELYNGKIPKGLVVRHTCDNTRCCNLKHLILGTDYDNVQDAVSRKRLCKTLPEEIVKEIFYNEELSFLELSKKYNVHISYVSRIKNNKIKTFKQEINSNPIQDSKHKIKLSKQEVIEIFKSNLKSCKLSKLYNVSPSTIDDIRKCRTWKHITNDIK